METGKNEKNENKYFCEKCDFKCRWKCDWNRHLTTTKHLQETDGSILETDKMRKKNHTVNDNNSCTKCPKCDNIYKSRSGLWKHIKICTAKTQNEIIADLIKYNNNITNLVLEQNSIITKSNETMANSMIKTNETMVEMAKQVTAGNMVNSNNHITNNITNNFNLQLFLNDKCKDAVNITDFIDNIQIQMNELENVGTNGYVNGITDIILARLKDLDVTKRPVHCTDLKREVLYIRDDNEWNRDEDRSKIKNMITKVASKNYRTIPQWRDQHPDCKDPENRQYDFCINMMRNSLGELGDEQARLDNKIIKNIAKEVVVDKASSV
jgi:K+-transporting ATPase c subunit